MISNEAKDKMLVMVLADLAGICKKLAKESAIPETLIVEEWETPETLRVEAGKLGQEFDSLVPYLAKGTAAQHAQIEELLIKMARFLPRLLDVEDQPSSSAA